MYGFILSISHYVDYRISRNHLYKKASIFSLGSHPDSKLALFVRDNFTYIQIASRTDANFVDDEYIILDSKYGYRVDKRDWEPCFVALWIYLYVSNYDLRVLWLNR